MKLILYRNLETMYPKYEKIQEKFVTASLRISDIFIKFFEIYQIRIISNVILQETMSYVRCLNLRYIPYKALR